MNPEQSSHAITVTDCVLLPVDAPLKNLLLFGPSVGFLALAFATRLVEAPEWLVELAMLAGCLFWIAAFLKMVPSLRDNTVSRITSDAWIPYAGWSAPSILFFSWLLQSSPWVEIAWEFGFVAACLVLGVGLLRKQVVAPELPNVVWTVGFVTAGLFLPKSFSPEAVTLFSYIADIAALCVFFVIARTTVSMVKGGFESATRSPWYGIGATAALARWLVREEGQLVNFSEQIVFVLLVLIAGLWFRYLLKKGMRTHGAWANLLALCTISALFTDLHMPGPAAVMAVISGVSMLGDIWQTHTEMGWGTWLHNHGIHLTRSAN